MWNLKQAAAIVAGWVLATGSFAGADDWTRFRGPNGSGVAAAGESVPAEWGEDQNLAWKLALAGAGVVVEAVAGAGQTMPHPSSWAISSFSSPGPD